MNLMDSFGQLEGVRELLSAQLVERGVQAEGRVVPSAAFVSARRETLDEVFADEPSEQETEHSDRASEHSDADPLLELLQTFPADVSASGFKLFPSSSAHDFPLSGEGALNRVPTGEESPASELIVLETETRRLTVSPKGALHDQHPTATTALSMTLSELIELAIPFVGHELRGPEGARYLPPEVAQNARHTLGARFERALDLFGIATLEGVRADLSARMNSSSLLTVVALVLVGAIVAIVLQIESKLAAAIAGLALACVPLAIVFDALRKRRSAQDTLARLPR